MKATILVVEDNAMSMALINNILSNEGYEVVSSKDGEIFNDLRGLNCDLILLDVMLPGISGYHLCKKLKRHKKTRDIPVIFVTSQSDGENVAMGFESGGVDYITKPFTRQELLARVKNHLTIRFQQTRMKNLIDELEKLSVIASKTDNSIIIVDKNGHIEWINEGFEKLYGYNLEELRQHRGHNVSEISSHENIYNVMTSCLEKKTSIVYESKGISKFGKTFWVQTTLTPIFHNNGDIFKMIAIESDITRIKLQEQEIKLEKSKSESLLLNILPKETAIELINTGKATPKKYISTVLFADIKDFSNSCVGLSPEMLVRQLHNYFVVFDRAIEKYRIEKIKTIGDAYMCAGGLKTQSANHPLRVVLASLEIQQSLKNVNKKNEQNGLPVWYPRIGIHTGEVVAGVVGETKFAYDIWGDTVNIAARMEQSGQIGKINISETTYDLIKDFFDCTCRGKIEAKNKGKIDMYFVDKIKSEFTINKSGIIPNKEFLQILDMTESPIGSA